MYYCSKCGSYGDYWFTKEEDERGVYLTLSMGPPLPPPITKERFVSGFKVIVAFFVWLGLMTLAFGITVMDFG
jgi:hypothetical protein